MDDTIVVPSAKIASPNMDVPSSNVTLDVTETVKQGADGLSGTAAGIDWMKIGKYALIVLILAFLGSVYSCIGQSD